VSPLVRPARRVLALATAAVALATSLALAGPAAHAGGAHHRHGHHAPLATPDLIRRDATAGRLSPTQAARYLLWAFTAPARVPTAYRSATPWDGTLPLLHLQEVAPSLGDTHAARAVRAGVEKLTTLPCRDARGPLAARRTTKHFYIEYDARRLRGVKVGGYTNTLERTWDTEVRSFKWAAPPKDPHAKVPGGKYLVRIQSLGTQLYGYVTGTVFVGDNPHTRWNDKDAVASCMVLNQNFGPFPGTPLNAMRATVAHEFNHSLQFGYGALTGPTKVESSWVEGGATWMEDEVFSSSNDNYNYLWPDITKPMPLFDPSFPYPYWVVFRAMTEPFGTGTSTGGQRIFRYFWEQLSRNASTNSQAFDRAFKSVGSDLATAYHQAGIALRFTVPCGGGTPEPYCLKEADAYVAAAGPNSDVDSVSSTLSRSIPNDFATNWIGLAHTGTPTVTVKVDSGAGKLDVSLVCRQGTDTLVVTDLGTAVTGTGGQVSVSNYPANSCDEVSAVISNVEMTSATPASKTTSNYTIAVTP
jgi:hypothetical protein